MMAKSDRLFGDVPGIALGAVFPNRKAVAESGLHGPWRSGIHGNRVEGASSIVVSGGYVDDEDLGQIIIYTGHGGRDAASGRQVRDQSLDDPGNAGLVTSCLQNLPVRVIRGESGGPYTYEGLFRVTEYWSKVGSDRFRVWQFRLEAIGVGISFRRQDPVEVLRGTAPEDNLAPGRRLTITQRLVRSTRVIEYVKLLYDDRCQICSTALVHPGGRTSEGAHIRGLGEPHQGQDSVSNVLCLCPNHHTLFDRGGVWISDDLEVFIHPGNSLGKLNLAEGHEIDTNNLRYHRSLWGF